jgi:hypothetical protein
MMGAIGIVALIIVASLLFFVDSEPVRKRR